MDTYDIRDFTKGWFIGNFEPAILKTDQFEVGVQKHTRGAFVEKHYQKHATEYNVIITGRLMANGKELSTGDIFVYLPEEVTDVVFLEDTEILCVKTPSLGFDDKVVLD